jgi:phage-related protein
MAKKAVFLGDTRQALRDFPDDARREAGFQISLVENDLEPNDWKPFPTVGPGVREIRVRERSGAFRVIYQATLPDTVLVLNVFQKKTHKTSLHEIDKARDRFKAYLRERGPK